MQHGKASRTALRVAIRRAAHQLVDDPPVLVDPVAVKLIGQDYPRDLERASHTVARDFRAYLAARSRFAEDHLVKAIAAGVRQYVILGAGLDTFAYRNPFPDLRVFEADFPATQDAKREMLAAAGIALPPNLTFVPLDFEHKTLLESLFDAGINQSAPAFFSWLGVAPYLTIQAFRSTLAAIGTLPEGTGVAFDYSLPPETLTPERRAIFDRLAERVAAAGEPFQLFFTPEQMDNELRQAGFRRIEQLDHEGLNQLYFQNRADGLKLSPVRIGIVVAAWK
ncbi:class I SAM-dependent methyltransferase [Occallatibacter riparius]|uniref:S-adenosyl-L-methionine-dependent methyltransferase n=1 Tax=Occallatibacter riparius TaxID=1002689 RepID=A0A9J7BFW2_9BACT|nr:SAM-dependent methyltransferase [Occallatibacter riparius]UWZ81664.1 SAM-dependent methyltransferase [Occallatibacter riparius]